MDILYIVFEFIFKITLMIFVMFTYFDLKEFEEKWEKHIGKGIE